MESIESLPYYMSLAQGASPPKGRQMTIRWYAHLSRDALVMDVGGQVFHLLRVQKPELPHLNVIGELREADAALGGLEKIVSDDGSANTDAADALPTDTEWLALPNFARPSCFHRGLHKNHSMPFAKSFQRYGKELRNGMVAAGNGGAMWI